MVANITTGKDVYGALAYNQEKVDRGDGKVLLTHIVREPADGRFNVAATAEDLLRWMPSHYRTEKPVVHVSLNPAPEDRLDDGQLAEIAGAYMERMGWGGQPYIVFKHTDIGREHIHIVSVQVAQTARMSTLCCWELCHHQRKENNIVDPKNDLQQRQRTERKPGVRIGYPCK